MNNNVIFCEYCKLNTEKKHFNKKGICKKSAQRESVLKYRNTEKGKANVKKHIKNNKDSGKGKIADAKKYKKQKEKLLQDAKYKEDYINFLKIKNEKFKQKMKDDDFRKKYNAKARLRIKKTHRKIKINEYQRKIRQTPQNKIKGRLRNRIWCALFRNKNKSKKINKNNSAIKSLGCSIDFFIQWIANQFDSTMSWENRKSFHLDHIIPLSYFDLTDEKQFKIACHYKNIRPLNPIENVRKSDKIIMSIDELNKKIKEIEKDIYVPPGMEISPDGTLKVKE